MGQLVQRVKFFIIRIFMGVGRRTWNRNTGNQIEIVDEKTAKNKMIFDSYQEEALKKEIVSYPPLHATIGIHGYCSFKCIFCVNHGEDARNNPYLYKVPYRFTLDELKRCVDWAYKGGIPKVHLCAEGEPLLHTEFFPMMDYVIEKYGNTSLQTDFSTAIFENKPAMQEILKRKEHLSFITTDILSWDPKVHESIKVGSNFEKLLEYMQYISNNSDILLHVHHVVTHQNYQDLYKLPKLLKERNIHFRFDVVNLHAYGFNSFTAVENAYTSKDTEIKKELDRVAEYCESKKIPYQTPIPFDQGSGCRVFWSRIQVLPVKTLPEERWLGNVIPGYCNAVVNGGLETTGNLFDYENVMDFWNNPILVKIRKDLIAGKYPTEACKICQNYAANPPTVL